MKKFIEVKVESECCQKYGICGEQFVSDISFDKNGKVSSTRFRFFHTPVHYQDNFIGDLVLTRRVADLFSEKLIQNKPAPNS
jgi:Niemann-Pick C1 protein